MKTLQPTQIDLTLLAKELEAIPYTPEQDYIEMASAQSDNHLLRFPMIQAAVNEIASLRKLTPVYMMVNKLMPGKYTPWHQDYLKSTPLQPHPYPLIERWHLPVVTNDLCWFEERIGFAHKFPLGIWMGPVRYWNYHRVTNHGETVRVHLVVDLDTPDPMGQYEH